MSQRGVYGVPDPTPPKGHGWRTLLVVAGLGAGAYFAWPTVRRRLAARLQPRVGPPVNPPAAAPAEYDHEQQQPPQPPHGETELERLARLRGFDSVANYEESVLGSAREVMRSGSEVHFTPHLSHLIARLRER